MIIEHDGSRAYCLQAKEFGDLIEGLLDKKVIYIIGDEPGLKLYSLEGHMIGSFSQTPSSDLLELHLALFYDTTP